MRSSPRERHLRCRPRRRPFSADARSAADASTPMTNPFHRRASDTTAPACTAVTTGGAASRIPPDVEMRHLQVARSRGRLRMQEVRLRVVPPLARSASRQVPLLQGRGLGCRRPQQDSGGRGCRGRPQKMDHEEARLGRGMPIHCIRDRDRPPGSDRYRPGRHRGALSSSLSTVHNALRAVAIAPSRTE